MAQTKFPASRLKNFAGGPSALLPVRNLVRLLTMGAACSAFRTLKEAESLHGKLVLDH